METSEITEQRVKKYLQEEGKRFDGRNADEFRELVIETSVSKNAEGSALVKLGDTEVLVGVKLSVGEPYPDSKDQGNLMVTYELLPSSSSRIESGPPGIDSIEMGRVIDRGIRESKIIDLKKLCIEEGERVWTVMIDIYSMNDDGNLLDAAGIGAIAALKNTIIPNYNKEEGKIDYSQKSKEKLPVAEEFPFTITIHKIGKNFIVDPSRMEEDLSEARVTLGISGDIISSVQKGNSEALELGEFEQILDVAEKVGKDLKIKFEKALKA